MLNGRRSEYLALQGHAAATDPTESDLQPKRARDHNSLNFRSVLSDAQDPVVSEKPFHQRVLHEPITAVNLDSGVGDSAGKLRAIELGHRCRGSEVLAGVTQPSRTVQERARVLDLGGHVGQLERDPLESADRAGELRSLLGVPERSLERPLGASQPTSRA